MMKSGVAQEGLQGQVARRGRCLLTSAAAFTSAPSSFAACCLSSPTLSPSRLQYQAVEGGLRDQHPYVREAAGAWVGCSCGHLTEARAAATGAWARGMQAGWSALLCSALVTCRRLCNPAT